MARKGQGISINVIVIAAIALLVLVILSTLVIRAGSTTNKSAQDCLAIEGSKCVPEEDYSSDFDGDGSPDGCGANYVRNPARACSQAQTVCCTRL